MGSRAPRFSALDMPWNGVGSGFDIGSHEADETAELMPMPISLSHKMAKRLSEVRKNGTVPFFLPDGKSQVTIEYDENETEEDRFVSA